MPLKCPNCKRRYADESVYCEECGESLVSAGPTWRKWTILGLGAVLVVAAVWGGLSYVESNVRDNLRVEFSGTPNYELKTRNVGIPITIRNNSLIDLTVDSVNCQATLSGLNLGMTFGVRAICDGSLDPIKISKDDSKEIMLNVKIVAMDPVQTPAPSGAAAEVHVRAWGVPVIRAFAFPSLSSLDPKKISAMFVAPAIDNDEGAALVTTRSAERSGRMQQRKLAAAVQPRKDSAGDFGGANGSIEKSGDQLNPRLQKLKQEAHTRLKQAEEGK